MVLMRRLSSHEVDIEAFLVAFWWCGRNMEKTRSVSGEEWEDAICYGVLGFARGTSAWWLVADASFYSNRAPNEAIT